MEWIEESDQGHLSAREGVPLLKRRSPPARGWREAGLPSGATAHGGSLTLTPREAGGLGVTVQLPAAHSRDAVRADSVAHDDTTGRSREVQPRADMTRPASLLTRG